MQKSYLWLGGVATAALVTSAPALSQQREPFSGVLLDENGNPESMISGSKAIVVLGSRSASTDRDDFTGSVTFINPEDLEARQTRNVEDLLRDVPGIAVSTVAGQSQIRLRGSEANHVLVLVDGIEVSDPGSGEYDIGTLHAEIGSRIEVLRGPQSALYGNDAVSGVIAYDSGEYEGLSAFAEGGSNNTLNGALRWGADPDYGFATSFSATFVSTDGEPNARGGTRDIGRDSFTLSGKTVGEVATNLELRGVARYTFTQGQFNDQDFGFGSPTVGLVVDSPGNRFENESFSALVGARLESADRQWTNDLSAQITKANRQTEAPAGFPSSTQSDRFKLSYVSDYHIVDGHRVTVAADYELEGFNNVATFDDRKEAENVGFVAEYRYAGGRDFDFAAAIRHDVNDLFQDTTTFRVSAAYDVTETTRIRAAVGTGVKNPTLNELFGFFDGTFIGNPDLQPEESLSWEVGVDQRFAGGDGLLSITYFNAELEDEIFTTFPPPNFVATPGNRATDSSRQGVEVALGAQLDRQWSVNAAYTYLDAEENGVTEVRRPRNTASAALTWNARNSESSASLVVRHNGNMLDSDFTTGNFPAPVTRLEAFTLVNINATYELTEGLSLFARAENLLDETYEQVFSFVSPGRQVIAGFKATF